MLHYKSSVLAIGSLEMQRQARGAAFVPMQLQSRGAAVC